MTEDLLASNVANVRARIAAAARRSGRRAEDITLIAVSKTHGADAVIAALRAGVHDFGENKVQEAEAKIAATRDAGAAVRWHMVGHLQRNKAHTALDLFDILHSVDSDRLIDAIDSQAARRVPILIEVNIASESTKFGVSPDEAERLADQVRKTRNLELLGLMTVAPQVDDPERVRPLFRELKRRGDALGVRELSMGMTDDFEVAIEEGATLVRVGRAIFGPRPLLTAQADA